MLKLTKVLISSLSFFFFFLGGVERWYMSWFLAFEGPLSVVFAFSSERVDKIKVSVHEAGGIFQLRVVTDVLIQDGECGPLDQVPAGATHLVKH